MTVYDRGPVKINWIDEDHQIITSTPPFFSAEVTRRGDRWVFTMTSHMIVPMTFTSRQGALTHASTVVARMAYRELHERMQPDQRLAVSERLCPFRTGRPLCRLDPMPGSVWCVNHGNGRLL